MNDVAVIMCTWNRVLNLNRTLINLKTQTYTKFDFFIWNNNTDLKEIIDTIISKENILNVQVHHHYKNIGGFGRFYYAKNLNNQYKKIIFIDDDQILGSTVIKSFVDNFQLNTILSWWAWKINKGRYVNRTRSRHLQSAHYCGTGGMIIDSSIFSDEALFNCPEEFNFIEDLWLSYYANYYLNWKLQGISVNISINYDNKDQSIGKNVKIYQQKKQKLLQYAIDSGWKLL